MGKAKKIRPKKKKVSKAVKKPKFRYKVKDMVDAVNAVKESRMSCKAAAEHYSVPRTTLRKKLTGLSAPEDRKVGPEAALGDANEVQLVNWIMELSKLGFPVTKIQLLDSVTRLVRNGNFNVPFTNDRPGRKWYDAFLKRHPIIAERTSQNLTKSRAAVTKENLINWSENVESYLKSKNLFHILKDPTRVFNADEFALFLCPKAGLVLARKGDRNVYSIVNSDEKENLTVMMGGNAAGNLLPPMVVFKYERVPQGIANSIPGGWGIGRSESGWMTCPVFFEYVANIIIPWLDKNKIKRPVLFFLDGHASHLSLYVSDLCKANGIELIALHPNSTHLTQPMDVAVFHALKDVWKEAVTEWRLANSGEQLKKDSFCPLLEQVINEVMYPEILKNGFEKCGLVPWNINAVDFSKIRTPTETTEPYALRNLKIAIIQIENEIGEVKLKKFHENKKTLENLSLSTEDINLFQVWLSFNNQVDRLLAADKQSQEAKLKAREKIKLKAQAKANSKATRSTISFTSSTDSPINDSLSLPTEMNLENFPSVINPFDSSTSTLSASKNTSADDLRLFDNLMESNIEDDLIALLSAPVAVENIQVEMDAEIDISKPSTSKMVTNNLSEPNTNEAAKNDSLKIINVDEVPEKNNDDKIDDNLEKNTPDKSNNYNKNVPTPFKKALFWPEVVTKKNGKKKRSNEVMPAAITSTPWKKFWQGKNKKKEDDEKAKEERKVVREKKKKEKEELQKEKEEKKKQKAAMKSKFEVKAKPKPKRKPRRQLVFDTSDEDSETSSSEAPPSPTFEERPLSKLEKDKYVIFLYEGEYFPGLVLEATETGAKIRAMAMAGPDGWRWPEKEDVFHYDLSQIKEVIQPPTIRNSRGVWHVQEIAKYRK